MAKRILVLGGMILALALNFMIYVLYRYNIIAHRTYTNQDFSIETFRSDYDQDSDGIDDQTDILENAINYVAARPKYKSQYYADGYPNDGYGVCTDVVAFALKDAGYDLKQLVYTDMQSNPDLYDVKIIDANIDFRRVENLKIYLDRHALSLTTDILDIAEWQGGDIVVFAHHIGIVSDKRNQHGVPFIIHHAYPHQLRYVEDILEYRQDIVGHYRIQPCN